MPTSQTFDSALTYSGRRLIRTGVMALLADLTKVAGKYLAGIVELAAPFRDGDDELVEMFLRDVGTRTPVVAVALGSQSFGGQGTGDDEWMGDLSVHVYLMTTHAGGLTLRQKGDAAADLSVTKDPGLDTALEHVFSRLAGKEVGNGMPAGTTLTPESEEVAYFGADYTIWEQVYKVTHTLRLNHNRATTETVSAIQTWQQSAAQDSDTVTTVVTTATAVPDGDLPGDFELEDES